MTLADDRLLPVAVRQANFGIPDDIEALSRLMQIYALDHMGGGKKINHAALERLPDDLRQLPHARSWIAFEALVPVGLINAFLTYSTFLARPVLNIHDLVVDPAYRGRGIGRQLMSEAETAAQALGCAKVTLEVLERNISARQLYSTLGYGPYTIDGIPDPAHFWEKRLP